VIAAYLIAITWFGARFGKGQKGPKYYLLGGRTAPWWSISLSIVFRGTSTLTIVRTRRFRLRGISGSCNCFLAILVARIVISSACCCHTISGNCLQP